MTANSRISNLINSQVPFFVRNDHQQFVTFIEKYYEFLEQTDGVLDIKDNIVLFKDIDYVTRNSNQTNLEVLLEEKLYATFLKLFPKDMKVDKSLLLKHAKEFYLSRGSEKSIRFLMNILFGQEDVSFYYPKIDVLKASDGKWYIQQSLKITDTKINGVSNSSILGLEKFVSTSVTGNTSHATATIERVDRFYEGGTLVDELVISNLKGTFTNGEQVFTLFNNSDYTIGTASANIFGGILNTVTIVNAGANYIVGDPVIVESSTGSDANVQVARVSSGNIASISVLEGGAGYQNNNYLLISGGGGSGANGYVSLVNPDGLTHPNTYNIYFSQISLEANTIIGNSSSNVNQSFAYQNLRTIYTNTSNIRANSGISLLSLNLSSWLANSNVYFETYDSLNVTNQVSGISNTVLITSTNSISNVVWITPAFSTRQANLTIQVIKKANANTAMANSFDSFIYGNTGPARTIVIASPGSGFTSTPSISILANTRIRELGVLGRMQINNGGLGYQIGDTIDIINVPGGYGVGASANVTNVAANGMITRVKFKEVPGHIIGGAGYSEEFLPTANVISANASAYGANISVTNILGVGGSFITANTTLGAIERLIIFDRGSGYLTAPTLNLTQIGDGTAQASATIIEGVYSYPGRYLNDDGMLSTYNFLQDRDYYQNFSYVIKLQASIESYRQALKSLIHPAGMKLFGEYIYDNNNESYNTVANVEDVIRSTIKSKTYVKTGNTVNIAYTSHGLSVNSNVSLEFISGGSKNVKNGIYRVTSTNTNHFLVVQPRSGIANISIANTGTLYNSNSFIVFSSENGKTANASYTKNTQGSIVSVKLLDYGAYYSTTPTATANGSNSVPATFVVTLNHYANNTSGTVNVATLFS